MWNLSWSNQPLRNSLMIEGAYDHIISMERVHVHGSNVEIYHIILSRTRRPTCIPENSVTIEVQ